MRLLIQNHSYLISNHAAEYMRSISEEDRGFIRHLTGKTFLDYFTGDSMILGAVNLQHFPYREIDPKSDEAAHFNDMLLLCISHLYYLYKLMERENVGAFFEKDDFHFLLAEAEHQKKRFLFKLEAIQRLRFFKPNEVSFSYSRMFHYSLTQLLCSSLRVDKAIKSSFFDIPPEFVSFLDHITEQDQIMEGDAPYDSMSLDSYFQEVRTFFKQMKPQEQPIHDKPVHKPEPAPVPEPHAPIFDGYDLLFVHGGKNTNTLMSATEQMIRYRNQHGHPLPASLRYGNLFETSNPCFQPFSNTIRYFPYLDSCNVHTSMILGRLDIFAAQLLNQNDNRCTIILLDLQGYDQNQSKMRLYPISLQLSKTLDLGKEIIGLIILCDESMKNACPPELSEVFRAAAFVTSDVRKMQAKLYHLFD